MVHLEKVNDVFIRVHAEPSILMEMAERFQFYVPGYQFSPAFKNKQWDGKIRLLHVMTGRIYLGLMAQIFTWCKDHEYSITFDEALKPTDSMSDEDVMTFAEDIDCVYTPRDYQAAAVSHAVSTNRALFLSPTASGKSMTIYLLARYHQQFNRKILIIVPTVGLVAQMAGDFKEYNGGNDLGVHQIKAGVDKYTDLDYTVSTWQSLAKMKGEYFNQFDVVIGDEAHTFKAKVLTKLMEHMTDVPYRYGFTGTLDGSTTNKLVLEGLFGPVKRVASTDKLIQDGTLAEFDIKGLVFEYTDEERKGTSKMTYQEEVAWIISHERRNKYIAKLAQSIPGNTLILFNFVEKHGKVLKPILEEAGNKKVHFIHGDISAEERERIRHLMEESSDNILLASFGTFSTGSNVKRLDNLIMASPSKSKIRVLQSIGRILRKGNGSIKSTLYDIADDLKWKKRENFALKHFKERVDIYMREKFNLKIFNIKI